MFLQWKALLRVVQGPYIIITKLVDFDCPRLYHGESNDDANHNADKSDTSHTHSEATNLTKGSREDKEQKVQQTVHQWQIYAARNQMKFQHRIIWIGIQINMRMMMGCVKIIMKRWISAILMVWKELLLKLLKSVILVISSFLLHFCSLLKE